MFKSHPLQCPFADVAQHDAPQVDGGRPAIDDEAVTAGRPIGCLCPPILRMQSRLRALRSASVLSLCNNVADRKTCLGIARRDSCIRLAVSLWLLLICSLYDVMRCGRPMSRILAFGNVEARTLGCGTGSGRRMVGYTCGWGSHCLPVGQCSRRGASIR